MRFVDFKSAFSISRINRYLGAVSGNTKKAMTLYRLNLRLSQELFTVISCFEIILRNKIDEHYLSLKGADWLQNSIQMGGMFYGPRFGKTPHIIRQGINKLPMYSHTKLIAELEFGFWRYLLAPRQFRAGGSSLLSVFPFKPVSSAAIHYNNRYFFNELEKINDLRNRIAHHEPVCFYPFIAAKDTTYAREIYYLMIQLFQWMGINEVSLLYGLDHVESILNKIDAL